MESKVNIGMKSAHERGFKVLNDGTVISHTGRILKGYINSTGYIVVAIRVNKIRHCFGVHKLMAYQKYGESMFEDGIVVRHLNGNSLDNSFDNIAIGTQQQNNLDKTPEVRMRAALHAASFIRKHDKEKVKEYFKDHGFKKAMIHFGISSKGTMSYIINH